MAPLIRRRELLTRTGLLLAGGAVTGSPTAAAEPSDGSSSRDLTITSVQTFQLFHKLRRPFGVSVSVPFSTTRSALLVSQDWDGPCPTDAIVKDPQGPSEGTNRVLRAGDFVADSQDGPPSAEPVPRRPVMPSLAFVW